MSGHFTQISDHLFVHHSCVNVGIIRNGNLAMLIDCGDESVRKTLNKLDITKIVTVLFTHHHRDNVAGITDVADAGTEIGVPESERQYFEDVEDFWSDPKHRWHLYNYRPHNLMLAKSLKVAKTYKNGNHIIFGNAKITVKETPGHTDASVSYLIEVDGNRVVFSGDLIYDEGQIWDLYSLQKGDWGTDYHGFLGDRKRLATSLDLLKGESPSLLVPTHGNIISDPFLAIDTLMKRIDLCYDRYLAISALRHYAPDFFPYYEDKDGHMPIRSGKKIPSFLRHFGTTWIIISENHQAFVMDCGSTQVIREIEKLQELGEISEITELWVTHYHDDHVDAIPDFQNRFSCYTRTDSIVAQVIENPEAYRIPCISPAVVNVNHRTKDRESWEWNEFKMTAFHFPGQTYYHGGLLVEGQNLKLFFSGDSFTMAGIDDYCSGNRNWLGNNTGFDRCLRLIDELKPSHIFNCHVNCAFDFTDQQIEFMLTNLSERELLYQKLFPWDHPNYGMDEHWVSCYPYEQRVSSGERVELKVKFANHSNAPRVATCRPSLPKLWQTIIASRSVEIQPNTTGEICFPIDIPKDVQKNKRIVIPVDMSYNGRPLGQFREAIFVT